MPTYFFQEVNMVKYPCVSRISVKYRRQFFEYSKAGGKYASPIIAKCAKER